MTVHNSSIANLQNKKEQDIMKHNFIFPINYTKIFFLIIVSFLTTHCFDIPSKYLIWFQNNTRIFNNDLTPGICDNLHLDGITGMKYIDNVFPKFKLSKKSLVYLGYNLGNNQVSLTLILKFSHYLTNTNTSDLKSIEMWNFLNQNYEEFTFLIKSDIKLTAPNTSNETYIEILDLKNRAITPTKISFLSKNGLINIVQRSNKLHIGKSAYNSFLLFQNGFRLKAYTKHNIVIPLKLCIIKNDKVIINKGDSYDINKTCPNSFIVKNLTQARVSSNICDNFFDGRKYKMIYLYEIFDDKELPSLSKIKNTKINMTAIDVSYGIKLQITMMNSEVTNDKLRIFAWFDKRSEKKLSFGGIKNQDYISESAINGTLILNIPVAICKRSKCNSSSKVLLAHG
ncbi:uncharacterized protein LOC135927570 isoform X2 [Gordionus sp. m RMFG-2023]|uniref:uncharacterized protein LOC135927570 isoform X2 n=1 Tax=Gordionus sp. m RMFG-2023 TaxID=3053472 RepID=UPI0031FDA497